MMFNNQTKDLFQLQSDLIDTKVNMAVSNAIDKIIERIDLLERKMHAEMHDLRHEMNSRFTILENRISSLENRMIAVETKLGMVSDSRKGIQERALDYSFKAIWAALTLFFAYLIVQFHIFVH